MSQAGDPPSFYFGVAGTAAYIARSPLFPAVAVAVARERGLGFWREIDVFGDTLQVGLHQRLLVMFLCDEHVKRRHNEQSENCSDRHSPDEHETDRISRGRAGTGHQR